MESVTFSQNVLKTESRPEELNCTDASLTGLLLLMVAAGDAVDAMKRSIYYGKPLEKEKLLQALAELDQAAFMIAASTDLIQGGADSVKQFEQEGMKCPLDRTKVNKRLLHATVGMFGECGEMASALAKQGVEGKLDVVNFCEEMGDADWYKAIGHDELGVSEFSTRAAVIAKLQARYPDKFSVKGAAERDIAAERAAMEQSLKSTA